MKYKRNANILLIGGTGFIGYHLARKCLNKKWKVTSLSTKKPKKIRNLKKVKYEICDISNFRKLNIFLEGKSYDYVVNLGGYVDHKNKKKVMQSHFFGVKNLHKLLKEKKIKKFIQIGSSSEYGSNSSPQKENTLSKPTSFYGKAKLAASNYLIKQYKINRFPVSILRFYQLFGPNQDNNRFIPELIISCLNKKKFSTSTGSQFRDFLYVDDGINAIIKSIMVNKSIGRIINIGSGKPIQLKRIMSLVKKKLHYFNPDYGKIKLRKDELKTIYPELNKMKKVLKYKPKTDFKVGLNKTISYYKKHKLHFNK